MPNLLGGKGANLAEMTRIGLPVPAGFTISTEVCSYFQRHDGHYPNTLEKQVKAALNQVEKVMEARFGDQEVPLLLSVRSGAPVSMPGMMDTVLNLGLNDTVVTALERRTANPRFAWDCYRRFVQMFGNVVLGLSHKSFEHLLEDKKTQTNKTLDVELSVEDLKDLVSSYKAAVLQECGKPFPEDPWDQLWQAIGAVFGSWSNPRATAYRQLNGLSQIGGTAVNVQSMVFGNMGEDCATGVAFTRDPSNGENRFFGEYLINAQGEDVVAGIRTPQQISIEGKVRIHSQLPSMEETHPELYAKLRKVENKLENHYRDMQDLEFTIQNNKLWILQTRNGKRTLHAALKIAVDMVNEGLITREEAIGRIKPKDLDQLLLATIDPKERAKCTPFLTGLAASPGAATGQVVFTAEEATTEAEAGQAVILVREETSPEDIQGMHAARGILTARGGMTSHAAVVARGMGRPCVSGCVDLKINFKESYFIVNGTKVTKGDWITLDGGVGEVLLGQIPTREPEPSADFITFMSWADQIRRLAVRTNADTPEDARQARKFGAEGIGLCRTEHMFFKEGRILAVREMILVQSEADRRVALAKILPMQRGDFTAIFREMAGLPVTIRLLDPPLHEFIPHDPKGQNDVALALGISLKEVKERVAALHEMNPMLGHRGCRLGISYPEIYEMQVRAIMEAACDLVAQEGFSITPEIMIPLVGHVSEFKYLKKICSDVCELVMKEMGVTIKYLLGTMIELPRAALTADQIAKEAEFFSFGTNDLTQTTLGISRDDASQFIKDYVQKQVFQSDPFVTLDQEGVGKLIVMGTKRGRSERSDLKIGICGEHGGDPASIAFFEKANLDYVSCSPYRVYMARLAAARAFLEDKKQRAPSRGDG
ncbi:MAG: pyruvate, phosphate dikinase [Magnetococcus sp. DMHC-6]